MEPTFVERRMQERRDKQLQWAREIEELKERLGDRLVILTHHYQRPEIVRAGHFRGDSFELSRIAAEQRDARFIVFCGVHFMAQSARVLARDDQIVFHPNPRSGCPMADMAATGDLERTWSELMDVLGGEGELMPIAYMNTVAPVKAFCGARGGAVCTSSNARRSLEWAFSQRPRVLFLPDEHLGRNTGLTLGIPEEQMVVYDWTRAGGGVPPDALRRARIVLWKGYCHVHTWFTVDQIAEARAAHPGCQVVVHPECHREVVEAADSNGSTGFIVKVVHEAKPGSTIVIGTEVNLVERLADERPDCTVVPLSRSLCPNMYRIQLKNLHDVLADPDRAEPMIVGSDVVRDARVSLERMLALPN